MPAGGGSLDRRHLLSAVAGLPLLAASRGEQRGRMPPTAPAASLAAIGASRGIRFGSELLSVEIENDPAFRTFFASQCDILVPGVEAKWDHTEPAPGVFEFTELDRIVDYAAAHSIAVRMHTLLWGLAMPAWLPASLDGADRIAAAAILQRHIGAVVGRYRNRVLSWDVGNELSDPAWKRGPEGLTLTPWRRALGPECVDLAFSCAREADPHARLFLNEDGLEYRGARFDAKRTTYLRLIEGWKRRGVPIDGFGLQTHLSDRFPIDPVAYRRFLGELAGFGLELHLTELDVRDADLAADVGVRDRQCAALVGQVLDIALDERAVTAVLTWGLTDRVSYQDRDPQFRRPDGLPSRGLPFDRADHPKPMRDAIASALASAPMRAPFRDVRSPAAPAFSRFGASRPGPSRLGDPT